MSESYAIAPIISSSEIANFQNLVDNFAELFQYDSENATYVGGVSSVDEHATHCMHDGLPIYTINLARKAGAVQYFSSERNL